MNGHEMKRTAYIAFALLGLIWGSNFIFVKWPRKKYPQAKSCFCASHSVSPIFLYALAKRALRWEHVRYAHHFAVMSLLATAVYYLAFAKGTVLLPSGIAGLLSGAIPLFTFLCAWLFIREEPVNVTKAAGVAIGFLGVLLIARPWSASGGIDLLGVAYMIGGSISVGCSFVYARRFISPLKLPAAARLCRSPRG
jgi:drug/metabolite transporter (DMT)-like permease